MKNDSSADRKRPEDIPGRIRELDATIANLDERIEKNKAHLDRNNASLTLKIAEICKATELKHNGSKR